MRVIIVSGRGLASFDVKSFQHGFAANRRTPATIRPDRRCANAVRAGIIDVDVVFRRCLTLYLRTTSLFVIQEDAMPLFAHFTEQECRAWIDAIIAIVRMPPAQRCWVG
ncbi:MAG: hypothetical protein ABIO59_11220 [Luteimonas sp.]